MFHSDVPSTMFPYSFPGGSDSKDSACNAGELGSIPESGRFPGGGNGYSLQYSCLENPMDRGAWQVTVHGIARVRHDLATTPSPPPFEQISGHPVAQSS